MRKKINAILRMGRPNNATEVCSFIGAVNFYKSLFPCRAHLLAPLTVLTGTNPFSWNDKKERAFCAMKVIVASDCINTHPDYNKSFDIYTDASDYQVGAAIIQDSKPIAYFSKN